ncbi:RNA-binding protein [Saprospiraceae bacterium]|nr:RNA-binding protein [Saprospiraceae bacterium]
MDASRGFGFVDMDNQEAALLAIKELHDTTLQGRSIVVKVATARN